MKVVATALLALFLVAVAAGPGRAVPASEPSPSRNVEIAPGERVDITFGPDGAPVVLARSAVGADVKVPALDNTYERVVRAGVAGATPPKPGQVTFTLVQSASEGSRLMVGNGYPKPIIYHAMLVFEHDGIRSFRATSICPVRAGGFSVESWSDPIVGVALSGFEKVDDAHLSCNGGSLMSETPAGAGPERFVCVGGAVKGALSPLTVALKVDSAGAIEGQSATWMAIPKDFPRSPAIGFQYAMEGHRVMPHPVAAQVMALVSLEPVPKAATADIVLSLNGVEKVRRRWRGYQQNIAQAKIAPHHPVAFFGIIPFAPAPDAADDGLRSLLAMVGEPGSAIDVRIVGDDGAVIAEGSYAADAPAVRDAAALETTLRQALDLAKTPTQCQKLDQ